MILPISRVKQYKLLKLDDASAEVKHVEDKNKGLREGLDAMMKQYPQNSGAIKRISNSLVKLKY